MDEIILKMCSNTSRFLKVTPHRLCSSKVSEFPIFDARVKFYLTSVINFVVLMGSTVVVFLSLLQEMNYLASAQ